MVCWNCETTLTRKQAACPHCGAETVRGMMRHWSAWRAAMIGAIVGALVGSLVGFVLLRVPPPGGVLTDIGTGVGSSVGIATDLWARRRQWLRKN